MKTLWSKLIVVAMVAASVACNNHDRPASPATGGQEKGSSLPPAAAQVSDCKQEIADDPALTCKVDVQIAHDMNVRAPEKAEEESEDNKVAISKYSSTIEEGEITDMTADPTNEMQGGVVRLQELRSGFDAVLVSDFADPSKGKATVYVFVRPEGQRETNGELELVDTYKDTNLAEVADEIMLVQSIEKDENGEALSVDAVIRALVKKRALEKSGKVVSEEAIAAAEAVANGNSENKEEVQTEEESGSESEPKADQAESEVQKDAV